jgi:hypothetical protein
MASRVQNNSRLSKDALSIIKPEDIPEYNHPVEASTPDAAEIIRQPHEETADTLARNSEVSGETAISNAGDRSFNRKKAKVYIEELNSRYGHSLGKFNAEFRIYQARDAADVSIYAELHLDDNLFSLQIALGKDWNNGKPYIGFWITTNSSSMDFVDEWLIVNYPEELDKPVINRADPVNDFAVLCRKEFSTDMSDSSHEEQLDLFMTDEVNKRLDALFPILVLTLQEVG